MKKHNLYDESVCVCVTARVCVCVLKSSVTRSILASLSLLVDFILSRVDPLSSHIHKDKMYGKFLYFGFPQKRAKRIPFLLFFFFSRWWYTHYIVFWGGWTEREKRNYKQFFSTQIIRNFFLLHSQIGSKSRLQDDWRYTYYNFVFLSLSPLVLVLNWIWYYYRVFLHFPLALDLYISPRTAPLLKPIKSNCALLFIFFKK